MQRPPVPILHAERLLEAFGYWHAFHDAEVHHVVLDRGGVDVRPSITMRVHVFDSSGAVDERGYFDVRVSLLATLRFADVDDVELRDFGVQNVLDALLLEQQAGGRIAVELTTSFGLSGAFTCAAMEVAEVEQYFRAAAG